MPEVLWPVPAGAWVELATCSELCPPWAESDWVWCPPVGMGTTWGPPADEDALGPVFSLTKEHASHDTFFPFSRRWMKVKTGWLPVTWVLLWFNLSSVYVTNSTLAP